jgi:hypothetical protein
LYWRGGGDTRWEYDPKHQDLLIDSPEFSLFSLGETTAKTFRLELELVRNSETGAAGLFWRGRIVKETGKQPEWRVLALYTQFMNTTGDDAFRLILSEFVFPSEGDYPRPTNRSGLNSVPIQFQVGVPNKLELEFSSGSLVGVLWNHQRLAKILQNLPKNVEYTGSGTFGVYNELGVTRFRDARFTLLEKER